MAELADFITVASPQATDNVLLLVDTQSDISILKVSCLNSNVSCNATDVVSMRGISGEIIKSIGSAKIVIKINHLNIDHKFYLVSHDFKIPCHGILGKDFIKRHSCELSYENMSFTVKPKCLTPTTISIQNEILPGVAAVPPRSEIFKQFHIKSKQYPCLVLAQDLSESVRVPTTIVHTEHCWIRVLNTSDETQVIKMDSLRASNLNDFNIYKGNGKNPNKPLTERTKRLLTEVTKNVPAHAAGLVLPLCEEFSDIFHVEGDTASVNNFYKQSLNVTDKEPVYTRNYRLPQAQKSEITIQVDKLLSDNLIELSSSSYNSPLIVVPKKSLDGKPKFRMCVDYRKLNRKLIPDKFPLPRIEDIFDNLGKSKYFSVMDLQAGFHQIPLTRDARKYTAFSTDNGMYQWKVLPFGLSVAPSGFSRMMA